MVAWLLEGAVKVAATHSFSAFLDDKYQLQINTTTTVVTFLLVALLQNSQTRSDQATQHKLNAVADAVADFMEGCVENASDPDALRQSVQELRRAVGLEDVESTD